MDLMIDEGNCYRFPDFTGLTLTGTSEELLALAAALTMKAKHPDNFFHTHTGVDGILLEIRHTAEEKQS